MRTRRFILALLALIPLALGADKVAVSSTDKTAELPRLDSQEFSRDVDGSPVKVELSVRGGADPIAPSRSVLQIWLESSLPPQDDYLRATVLNGMVTIGLPKGVEADGNPRLYYFDEGKGSQQFMYSRDYPRLDRFADLDSAFTAAKSNDREQILQGLTDISGALDADVSIAGPSDPRFADSGYSTFGISWLIPSNVLHKALVDPFDPDSSLQGETRLCVSLPLRISGETSGPIVVYAGGLSMATGVNEVRVSDLPADWYPLEPIPARKAGPPPSGDNSVAAQAGAAADSGEPGDPTPDKPEPKGKPASSSPDVIAPAESPVIKAAAPTFEWISWETEIDPLKLRPSAGAPKETVEEQPLLLDTTSQYEQPGAISEETLKTTLDSTFDHKPSPEQPEESTPVTGAAKPTPAQPPARVKPAPAPNEDGGASETVIDDAGGAAREVKPGTLPEQPDIYHVPLKPITATVPAGGGANIAAAGPMAAQGGLAAPGEMVLIPAGPFEMGTTTEPMADNADESPQHTVTLPAYYIDKLPVTNRQFYNFVISAGHKADGDWQKFYEPATADLPVRNVSWDDAAAFARWAGKRLPSEAEWEKAARGEDARTYPWGEEWSAEIIPRGENFYALVGNPKIASPYGVLAMCGVLWQWTASNYAPYPFKDKAAGDRKVLRGGCFSNGKNIVRVANRYAEPPGVALNTFTFRCAKDG